MGRKDLVLIIMSMYKCKILKFPKSTLDCSRYIYPDNNHSLDQRWHNVGSFVGPKPTNDDGPMSFCSSGRLIIANGWFDMLAQLP